MTVKATVTSTLNGQTAELVLIEDGESRRYEQKTLSGGTEELIFTSLEGGQNKKYTAKVVPSTNDVTQTAEVNYGAEIRIDPIPHRNTDASQTVHEQANFNQGVSAKELGLGNHELIGGLLTTALNDGEVLADDGYVYSTVQAAQDAASSWIFVGPGVFNENVTVSNGMTIMGSGYSTLIDGGVGKAIDATSQKNVTVSNLRAQTDPADGSNAISIGRYGTGSNLTVSESGANGIYIQTESVVSNSIVETSSAAGFLVSGSDSSKAIGCTSKNAGEEAFNIGADDAIVSSCIALSPSTRGISCGYNDCIFIGNRIHNAGGDGIIVWGNDNILANNRISNSTDQDIDDNGTGTVLDSNLTGSAN